MLSAVALPGLPEIREGDALARLIVASIGGHGPLVAGDVLVVAHKAVSKAEGRVRSLADVEPSARARALARIHDKDPRHVQVVLDESREVLRATNGVLICVSHHGFVCANAGVDASNVPGDETVVTAGQYRLKPGTSVEVVPDDRTDMVQNATTASAGMLP